MCMFTSWALRQTPPVRYRCWRRVQSPVLGVGAAGAANAGVDDRDAVNGCRCSLPWLRLYCLRQQHSGRPCRWWRWRTRACTAAPLEEACTTDGNVVVPDRASMWPWWRSQGRSAGQDRGRGRDGAVAAEGIGHCGQQGCGSGVSGGKAQASGTR